MKKLLGLFFEEDTGKSDGSNSEYFLVFVVWGLILLANGLSEYFFGKAIIDNWFIILAIGLVAFLLSEAFGKKTSQGGD
ncbi:hypothetical protein KQ939_05175 [Planococcus sp. CP5-4]|uniref:hypothetical protein n=1 Tax=unclassified Planococcus (in: firmicutes) TaxID=2662419 RepID=UPI001C20FE36|nr:MULTISPECIES: hypothetical protein [unclassified Planococcus (in: firmicutes)]MBU9673652.1 hypothetical protein [Planococcus sp. CP5-4_YE]MBV0907942.1 hypothetical protein [Planococcus sp. CP5-4_UN]MBW6063109.1 hypothetical protein [Planococcus sp. CP5-4]